MRCPDCDTELTGGEGVCPSCGAAPHDPETPGGRDRGARWVRIGFGVVMALALALVIAVAVLRPTTPSTAPSTSGATMPSPGASASADPDRAQIDRAIASFYAAIDAGTAVPVSPYVYPDGEGGPPPVAIDTSGTTTFAITRAVVGTGTADVFGQESRSVITTGGAEVEFRLRLVYGTWLITNWQAATPEPLAASQALGLNAVAAKDVVGTLLQAHQVGDSTTLRLVATGRFLAAHGSWLDGVDRSSLLTSWEILTAKPKGSAYTVTVRESWKPTPLTSTYTVVLSAGDVRVDAWTWK